MELNAYLKENTEIIERKYIKNLKTEYGEINELEIPEKRICCLRITWKNSQISRKFPNSLSRIKYSVDTKNNKIGKHGFMMFTVYHKQ